MEGHPWLHDVLVGLVEQQLILLDTITDLFKIKTISETYSKTEGGVDFPGQGSVLCPEVVTAGNIGGLNWLAWDERLDSNIEGLIDQVVGLLLGVVGINQECARSHNVHVAVLGTGVHIDGLRSEHILVALDVEFVGGEEFPTLDQDAERILKERGVWAGRRVELCQELFDSILSLKHLLNFVGNLRVLNLFLNLNDVLDLVDDVIESPLEEFCSDPHVVDLRVYLDHVSLIYQLLHLPTCEACLLDPLESFLGQLSISLVLLKDGHLPSCLDIAQDRGYDLVGVVHRPGSAQDDFEFRPIVVSWHLHLLQELL